MKRQDSEQQKEQILVLTGELDALYRLEDSRRHQLEEALTELRSSYVATIRALAFVVEAKDAYTGQHLERCRIYGKALVAAMGLAGSDMDAAEFGFLLHDAGKVGIPERILCKPGPLTAAEWKVMRTHPIIGAQIVEGIPFLRRAAEVIRYHHESYDGSGYPEGLANDDIPLVARIFSVVDCFDSMTTDRPYRAALPIAQAVDEIARMAGIQFDPMVCEAFVPMCETLAASPSFAVT